MAAMIVVAPLIAARFTDEVQWSMTDFVAAAVLLGGGCLAYELAARRSIGLAYDAAAGIAIGTGMLTVWLCLAVGIVGTERHPANLAILCVPAVGIAGALLARLRPRGMALAMVAAAVMQIGVAATVVAFGQPQPPAGSELKLAVLSAILAAGWAASAALFQKSASRLQA